MEGDSLESDQVIARGNSRGDDSGPGRVLRNHLAVTPVPIVDSAIEKTGLVDLEL